MQEVLSQYKERLINLSGRNRSLVTKRLYKKRAFDLKRLDAFAPDTAREVLSHLTARSTHRIVLLDDPYKERVKLAQEVTKRMDKLLRAQRDELKRRHSSANLETALEQLQRRYEEELKLQLDQVEKRFKQKIECSARLSYLLREINATEKETGSYELYVGYPFIEGRFIDDNFVRAPLVLFPVKVYRRSNSWLMEISKEDEVIVNKVFLYAYAKCYGTRPPEITGQGLTFNDQVEFHDAVGKLLNSAGIAVSDPETPEVVAFPDYKKENMPTYQAGQLLWKNHLVLGQFPISGSIYHDYEALEGKDLKDSLVAPLLSSLDERDRGEIEREDKKNPSSILEQDLYFLTSLDHSQELALLKSANSKQLVIYGPPGTGKSQTIVNIIGDHLAKGRRVLMVSQKRASLDVVYNRLSSLAPKVALVHDAKEKKNFYHKVSQALEEARTEAQRKPADLRGIARKIDQGVQALERAWDVLHKPRDFGLTLQRMYTLSQEIKDSDPVLDLILSLRKSNPFHDRTYTELKEAIDRIKEGKILPAYIRVREMLTRWPILSHVRSDVQRFDILGARQCLEATVLKERVSNLVRAKEGPWYEIVLQALKTVEFRADDVRGREIAEELAKKHHGHLLEKLNKGPWWSPLFWVHYRENKRQEMINAEHYEKARAEIDEQVAVALQALVGCINSCEELGAVFDRAGFSQMLANILGPESNTTEILSDLTRLIEQCERYLDLQQELFGIAELERTLLNYCYEHSQVKTQTDVANALDNLLQALIHLHIEGIESSCIRGRNFLLENGKYEREVEGLRQLMRKRQLELPGLIKREWSAQFAKRQRNLSEMRRQANKKKRLWPIRQFFERFSDELLDLFPCWLMGPETVSDVLPLQEGLFDVVIFDEASQMFIEKAIPSLFRGRRAIVAGDDKQLKPSSHFASRFNVLDDEFEDDGMDLAHIAALEEESLLDLAKVRYDAVHLNYHYRSRHEELINFSNYAFYGGRLNVSPNLKIGGVRAIERVKVAGEWNEQERNNPEEAKRVVEMVANILAQRKHQETLGIITFNINQKDLIEDQLDLRAHNDPEFRALYQRELGRQDGDEDASIFVKNIENVQGDERDIIIFSTGYAPGSNGRVAARFGSLSQAGGENRLNVAISRAKRKIYVVTSIEPEDLHLPRTSNKGPLLFKKYLQYARAVSDGDKQEVTGILQSLVDLEGSLGRQVVYDSDFEAEVREALLGFGFRVDTQVGACGYRIDLAVYDEETEQYVLGIECDGATFHSSKSARERDIHRQQYLENRGWTILRVWSRTWWKDRTGETQRLKRAIDEKLAVLRRRQASKLSLSKSGGSVVGQNQQTTEIKRIVKKPSQPSKKPVQPSVNATAKRVGFGDAVTIKDAAAGEEFQISIIDNPYNRHLMKEIEKKLLNRAEGERFEFKDHSYMVSRIDKYSGNQEELPEGKVEKG